MFMNALSVTNYPSRKQNFIQKAWKKLGLQGKIILLVFFGCLTFLALALGFRNSGPQNSLLPHASEGAIPGVSP